ncbi:DNA polymerase III subunit alpha [Bartonella sp. HY761]|uniref:DNA polymerase III subunit alpha n=1 Tax=Bartonella sp. HY761 TaxID=2979330 RepID=UPI00220B5E09|nr:DNA polymerase III subunit alpha [Bartonella sp. HY761]UXN07273.1 DNA polymerase III subunit alpha [Bartonella sp. HY761]
MSETTTQTPKSLSYPKFVHLRVHSAFSLLEGALKTDKIVAHAASDHEAAIAITDTNNLFGALEFTQKCFKVGIQPIIGCQLAVDFEDDARDSRIVKMRTAADFQSMVFLAANDTGYNNLVDLVSRAYLDKLDTDPPHIRAQYLNEIGDGIIVLTGGLNGPIAAAFKEDRPDKALSRIEFLQKAIKDRLYVELERQGDYDRALEAKLVELAYARELPLVATNEGFFLKREDYEAHDALLAIAAGQVVSNDDRRRITPDHYMKTQDEMVALFKDLPEAIENTVEIALRCHSFTPTRKPILPRFTGQSDDPDAALAAEAAELSRQAREGLKWRLETAGLADGYNVEDYEKRLEYEIGIIERMQFPGYFLIVADFIKWAKSKDIPVGPGRGSGAGSLVAYALTITDVDPLRFSLLFERFLNPDRVSMPDFDIDFCQDRREEVIRYVQGKYGREQVAQIITFGTLQARAVLRDVGRVLEIPYGQVDRLSKLVPSNPANPVSLSKAIQDEPKFAEEVQKEPVVGRLLDVAQKLEGLYRHASTHAAGIVIGDRPLWQLVPMYRDPRSDMPVTQFNMKYVEQAGLVKFDFLGLKTLTVLQTAVKFVARKNIKIDLSHIPLDDALTYEMMARGETVGVFQVESAGMRKALLGMKPDRIEDIIALVALYRPGPMENIPTYNARKHGEEEIASIHPQIDYLVKETQGVIVYQEQVMQIAQVLSGYSLGEADLLRRAMGKKIREEMDKQRSRFVDGAIENGVSKQQANTIFDLLAKFADYGFNKSHAAAYAIVSYQTAYMKAHYPVEFIAASMTYDMNNTDKLNDFRREAERLGIKVVQPSIQTSYRIFEVGDNCIYYSLSAIKGVGEQAVDHIVEVRGNKPFSSLEDFCERVDTHIVNRRALESLISAGALDCFGIGREVLVAGIDTILARSHRVLEDRNSGQIDIFGLADTPAEKLMLPQATPWLSAQKLHREFQAVGFYLSAHPLDEYKTYLEKMRVQDWAVFSNAVRKGASAGRLAGTVATKQIRKTRTGNKMGIIQFSDSTGQYEAILFSEGLAQFGDMLEPGQSVVITVAAENRPEGVSLRIQSVNSLEDEAARLRKMLRLFVRSADVVEHIKTQLTTIGDGEVSLILLKDDGEREIEILLPRRYRLSPQIAAAMKAIQGVVDVEMV